MNRENFYTKIHLSFKLCKIILEIIILESFHNTFKIVEVDVCIFSDIEITYMIVL